MTRAPDWDSTEFEAVLKHTDMTDDQIAGSGLMSTKPRILVLLSSASLTVASGLLTVGAVAGEESVISTDRPDFVEASTTVGRGRFQFETSVAYEREEEGGSRTTMLNMPTLLRYGVAELWELRLETAGYSRSRERVAGSPSTTGDGLADISLGIKWHVLDEEPSRRRH